MSRPLLLVLSILFSAMNTLGIEAVLSHTTFYLPDSSGNLRPYVEVAWQANPKSLHYVRSQLKTLSSIIAADIIFKNDTGIVREDRYNLQTPPKNTEQEILAMNVIKIHRYGLPAGHFNITVKLNDITDTNNKIIINDTLTISEPNSNPIFSGIQLLDTAYYAKTDNVFTKNDVTQIPLCTNFLDDHHSILHFYYELYNTRYTTKEEYPLVQHTFISQRENESPFTRFSKFDTIQQGQVLPFLGNFKITTLPSGNYYINVSLVNGLHRQVASSSLFFQRFNPNPEKGKEDTIVKSITDIENINVLDLGSTFVAKYSYGELRAILKMLIPVSDQAGYQTIKGFLKKPDELYMRYFIYNFFSNENKKDPKAAWDAYANKIREVNRLFSTSTTNGYETDRGLVFIRFGKPSERRQIENEAGTNPYEIWIYDVATQTGGDKKSGNGMFLFFKPSGSVADYTLLHSTVPGELRNPRWRSSLYLNLNGSSSSNSQAEQLIGNR
jgi:GWxTD domain-containing protein